MVRAGVGVAAIVAGMALIASGAGGAAAQSGGRRPAFTASAGLRTLSLPVPPPALDALRAGDGSAALSTLRAVDAAAFTEDQRRSLAFLVGWAAVNSGRAADALDLLPVLEATTGASLVPEGYRHYVIGELRLAAGRTEEALAALDKVSEGYRPAIAPLAASRAAEVLVLLGRQDEARARLEEAVSGLPASDRTVVATRLRLRLAALQTGEEAAALVRRVWLDSPGTPLDAEAVAAMAERGLTPTWQERVQRAERWMDAQDWTAALAELEAVVPEGGNSLDTCRLRFVRGRSLYKRNRIADAAAALAKIGPDCADIEADYGARGLYLLATAQYRRKLYQESADAYRQLVTYYPKHSMADDGLTRGGIALLEAGHPELAEAWWEEALRSFPEGDTVPEAQLRLALHRYLTGDGAGAMEVARQLGQRSYASDALHVAAGRYWAARWRLYPDASAPDRASTDPNAKAEAVAGWRALCEELPHSFYAIIAYARLAEVAPEVAAEVATRPANLESGENHPGWQIRWEVANDPHVRDGVALARLGLANEAGAEWALAGTGEFTPDERAWLSELRIAAGDWLAAHDELNRWLNRHPISTLGPREPAIVRLAFPDRYWNEVKSAVLPTYRYEPRLFHALIREESNFNATIVSFAGAIGLSQLMPATARQTASWMKRTVNDADLVQPSVNLPLGARYLDAVLAQLDESPYLALAAYNGGAANVKAWVIEDENPPTDEYVEQIPFEETRGYVKRVMGTWQTMRYRYDLDRPAFVDLSKFNHHALPSLGAVPPDALGAAPAP